MSLLAEATTFRHQRWPIKNNPASRLKICLHLFTILQYLVLKLMRWVCELFFRNFFDGHRSTDHDRLMLWPYEALDRRPTVICQRMKKRMNWMQYQSCLLLVRHLQAFGGVGEIRGNAAKSCIKFYENCDARVTWLSVGKLNGLIRPKNSSILELSELK